MLACREKGFWILKADILTHILKFDINKLERQKSISDVAYALALI